MQITMRLSNLVICFIYTAIIFAFCLLFSDGDFSRGSIWLTVTALINLTLCITFGVLIILILLKGLWHWCVRFYHKHEDGVLTFAVWFAIICLPMIYVNLAPKSESKPDYTNIEHIGSVVDTDDCDEKYYCDEMRTCREAYHYLDDCGLSRLDGDDDGVPCET